MSGLPDRWSVASGTQRSFSAASSSIASVRSTSSRLRSLQRAESFGHPRRSTPNTKNAQPPPPPSTISISGIVKIKHPHDHRPSTPSPQSRLVASLSHKARIRRARAAGAEDNVAREMANAVWKKCWLELVADELMCRTTRPTSQQPVPNLLDVAPSVLVWRARVSSVRRALDPHHDAPDDIVIPPLIGQEDRTLIVALDDDLVLQGHSGASDKKYRTVLIKVTTPSLAQKWFLSLSRVLSAYRFETHFKLGQQIGKGHQACVFSAVHRKTAVEVACKRMGLGDPGHVANERTSSTCSSGILYGAGPDPQLRPLSHSRSMVEPTPGEQLARRMAAANNEVCMLRRVDHPGVPKAIDMYFSAAHAWIVLEKVPGITLTRYLRTRETHDEGIARCIFNQLLAIVQYLHQGPRILHRDIKGDNIMVDFSRDNPWNPHVYLLDFAHASPISDNAQDLASTTASCGLASATTVVGTPHFCAPEIARRGRYSTKAESWSLGVVLFSLLVSRLPFLGETTKDVFTSILRGPVFEPDVWSNVSDAGTNLTKRLLAMEAGRRLSVNEALQHPFLS